MAPATMTRRDLEVASSTPTSVVRKLTVEQAHGWQPGRSGNPAGE